MCRFIHDIPIPIVADESLSPEKIREVVSELRQTWNWEGRELGKIELIRDGDSIRVCAYAKPTVTFITLKPFIEK